MGRRFIHKLPDVQAEVTDSFKAHKLPKALPIQENELRAEVGYASEVYRKFMGDELDCTIGSLVTSSYLRSRGFNAFIMPCYYLGLYHPGSESFSNEVDPRVIEIFNQSVHQRSTDALERISDDMGAASEENYHLVNLVRRENRDGRGNYFFGDITYGQFNRPGFTQPYQFDILDAVKLLEKYWLISAGNKELSVIREADFLIPAGKYSLDDELTARVKPIIDYIQGNPRPK